MALTSQVYTDFNLSLKELIDDLVSAFPYNEHMKMVDASFNILKGMSKKYPFRVVQKTVVPYESHILKRDDSFFMSDAFVFDFWPSFAEMLKVTWNTLDDTNKDAIWKHMLVLLAKCKKVNEYKAQKCEYDSGDDNVPNVLGKKANIKVKG